MVHGQESIYTSTNYSLVDGLSHYKIQSVFKDSDGYLWIGTEDGLNKFDGTNFINFINDPQDENSISSGNIYAIAQDSNGQIWVGVDGGGVNVIDPRTYKIEKLFSDDTFDKIKYIKDIHQGKNGDMWIASWGGLTRYNTISKAFSIYTHQDNENSIAATDVKEISQDSKGRLWLATMGGLSCFDPRKNSFTNYSFTSYSNDVLDDNIAKVFCDSKDRVWFSTYSQKFFSYDIQNNSFEQHYLNEKDDRSNRLSFIYEDRNNRVLFGNKDGIYTVVKSNNEKEFVNTKLIADETTTILEDNNGILYVGTERHGINVYKKNHFNFLALESNHYTNSRIRTIIGGKNNTLWFGSRGRGVVNFNRENNSIETFLEDSIIQDFIIESILIDSHNQLWVGTYDNGLYRYDFITKTVIPIITDAIRIEFLFECHDGVLWIATNQGTFFYDLSKNQIINAPERYHLTQEMLSSHQVHFIQYDNHGRIWYNVNSKVYVLDLEKGLNKRVEGIQSTYEYISFTHSPDGKYYLGTLNGGIVILQEGKLPHTITQKKGLASNRITAMLSGDNDRIWYSTTKGLGSFVDGQEKFFKKYNTSSGIEDLDYYLGAAYRDKEGWMYYGGVGGITYFHPDSLKHRKNAIRTIISDVRVYNQRIDSDTIMSFKKKIALSYKQDFLNFKFNSLDFSEKGEYKYYLKGLDEAWSLPTKFNEVSYTHIPPGEYTFFVKSSNSEGVWNDEPATIDIVITPPFWQRWWFYIIVFAFVVGLAALGQKMRERKLRTEAEAARFKLQALRSQMNPHFIFNALNSIQHFIIKNETKFALKYLTKFSQLVRKILENSFHLRISLEEEINFLTNYIEIESLRFGDNIAFDIEVDDAIEIEEIEIPSMLIQPYVENAILHGLMHKTNGGKIKIRFEQAGKFIKCCIEDDGVGREVSMRINKAIGKTHDSFGLPITKSRLEELNKNRGSSVSVTIEDIVENNTIQGTRVIVNIPIE